VKRCKYLQRESNIEFGQACLGDLGVVGQGVAQTLARSKDHAAGWQ
jgi:hypothetical protein